MAPRLQRRDPTRTSGLRRAFVAELNRRFLELRRSIIQWLEDGPGVLRVNAPFDFRTDPGRFDEFAQWLETESQKVILSGGKAGLVVKRGARMGGDARWSDWYIGSAYQAGIRRAIEEMKKSGVRHPVLDQMWPGSFSGDPIQAAFLGPVHADRVALLYTRTFQDLKGITADMARTMSRSLAESIAEGRNPRQSARIMLSRVPGLPGSGPFQTALARARTIARTETVRAHHHANINTYREAGVLEVEVVAEWSSADDDRVCDECLHLDGKRFTLDAILPMLPAHPNCRCAAIPKPLDEDGNVLTGRNKRVDDEPYFIGGKDDADDE